jgi:hypothetical protein
MVSTAFIIAKGINAQRASYMFIPEPFPTLAKLSQMVVRINR